jgi:uncharacterized protein
VLNNNPESVSGAEILKMLFQNSNKIINAGDIMNKEHKTLLLLTGFFLFAFFMPLGSELFREAIYSSLFWLNDYARAHVLTCLIPAFFIAGAIGVFIKKDVILSYLGPKSKKWVAYSIAAVSGAILAVCSCTILPLFAGIRKRGAGLGPAVTFLYSGPAINIAAMFLTISVLGFSIGLARIFFAMIMSIIIGLTMHWIYPETIEGGGLFFGDSDENPASKSSLTLFFVFLVGILIINGFSVQPAYIWYKYAAMIFMALTVAFIALFKFQRNLAKEWINETWTFTKILFPTLLIGVMVAGFIMPFLPESLIQGIVGSNTILGNLIASIFGAFMYFSTMTEIPIMQGLIEKGMHKGPALALLLAGPSLSLPAMLVIGKVLGFKKTLTYIVLVVVFSMIAGLIYGSLF